MSGWTLEEVTMATGGEVTRVGGALRFSGVATDSRSLAPGELFVALRGARHDGHRFVDEAVARGAGGVLVEEEPPAELATTVVTVRDTLAALGDLAAFHRRRHRAAVVAITGSNGKTTTKEMLGGILARRFGEESVLRTPGTRNNLVGLPLTLLALGDRQRVAVVELGMNAPGELWRLAGIASPDVGVLTAVAPAHLEGLGDIRGVIAAKAELFRRLRPAAAAVVNGDDPLAGEAAGCFAGRVVSFGEGRVPGRWMWAEDIEERGLDGLAFTLRCNGSAARVRLAVPGRHNLANALAAATAAALLGGELEVIAEGLEAFRPLPMRMQVVRVPGEVTVLNDAYNANPTSMAAALRTLAAAQARRRVAVLGGMRELGAAAPGAHRELGRAVAECSPDLVVVLGEHAGEVHRGATESGLPDARIAVARSHAEAAARLRRFLRPGDLVLLKGSRAEEVERVIAPWLEGAGR